MSGIEMRTKKGKNFKEVIEEEKNKGRTVKKIMHTLTNINSSVIYGCSFLLLVFVLDVVIYVALTPTLFVWAGILVATAVVSSLVASHITRFLKKQQWKYGN
jgi:hypothetical protein